MIVSIGTRRASGDVVDQLVECHGRIRGTLALASRLAATRDAAEHEIRDTAARVRRYFVEALPRHTDDEERELAPRIAGRDPRVDEALATMHGEHLDHERAIAKLCSICETIAADPSHLPTLAPDLAALVAGLEIRMAEHLRLEEDIVFPAVRALPAAEQTAIADAMRARRE